MLRLRATTLWSSLSRHNSRPLLVRLRRGNVCSCSGIAVTVMLGGHRRNGPHLPSQQPPAMTPSPLVSAVVMTTRLRLFSSSFEPSAENRTERELLVKTTSGDDDATNTKMSAEGAARESVDEARGEDSPEATATAADDDDASVSYEELTLIEAPTEEERIAATAATEAQQRQATTTVKILFCLSKWEVFPGAIIQDVEGPSHVSLTDLTDIQRQAQEFYQDWDTPLESIHLDYYNGTEWIYLHDMSLLEPYKLNKRPVPVRNQRFFDDPNILTTPYRHCV
jgi:hypothetical protein